MPPILKCNRDDEDRELDFELDYQLSLSVEERFRMMFQKSREAASRIKDREDLKVLRRLKNKQ